MVYYCIDVQKQLHTILETLTKDAVAEIGKLIEDGSAVLRLEIFHSQKENETLKMKLQKMERELKTARENGKKSEEFKDVFATRCVLVKSTELLSETVIKKERLEDQEDSLGGNFETLQRKQPNLVTAPKGEVLGAEPFQQEEGIQPAWPEEAGSGIGPSHQGGSLILQDPAGNWQNSPASETLLLRSHAAERPFHCSYCGKHFSWKTSLKRHLHSHMQWRPFSCTTCGKGFSRKTHLQIHQRTHTGERPYSCTECGKCFHRLNILKTHQRIHTRVQKCV